MLSRGKVIIIDLAFTRYWFLFIRGLCTGQYDYWHSTPPLLPPLPLYVAINIAQCMVSPRAVGS